MSKALRFLQIMAKHQDCPHFTVFLTMKTSSQNVSITLRQISLKLHEHRGMQLQETPAYKNKWIKNIRLKFGP